MFRTNPLAVSTSSSFVAPSPDRAASAAPLDEHDDRLNLNYWAQRLVSGSELACARELSGLTDAALDRLAADFKSHPRRPRTDQWRLLPWIGTALAIAGGIFLVNDNLSQASNASGVHLFAIVAIGIGVIVGCVGALASYSLVSIEMAYVKVGLYVGVFNTQHPWLYELASLTRDQAPEAYRLEVLRERGAIRGVDFVMMQEIARAQAAFDLTRPAHHVVAQVQGGQEQTRLGLD